MKDDLQEKDQPIVEEVDIDATVLPEGLVSLLAAGSDEETFVGDAARAVKQMRAKLEELGFQIEELSDGSIKVSFAKLPAPRQREDKAEDLGGIDSPDQFTPPKRKAAFSFSELKA